MPIVYRGTKAGRYTRPKRFVPKSYGKLTRLGKPRYDRVIAPVLQQHGGKTAQQKPGAYLKAVLDPEKSESCIIPDLSCYPTSCYSLRETIDIPLTAVTGVGGIKFALYGSPVYNTENTATTTDAAYTYNGDTLINGGGVVNTSFAKHRVVGASLRLEHAGSDQLNQGLAVGTSYSRHDSNITVFNTQRNARNTIVAPVKDGLYIVYKPVDGFCFDMLDTTVAGAQGQFGTLTIHISGAAPTAKILVHLTVHYEGISNLNQGENTPGGSVYSNPWEFQISTSKLSDTSTVASGPSYASGAYSSAALHTATEAGHKAMNLDQAIALGVNVWKGGQKAIKLYK